MRHMDMDELIQALEDGSDEVYDTLPGPLVALNELGVALCEQYGIRVNVDSFGCAYAPEHLIR